MELICPQFNFSRKKTRVEEWGEEEKFKIEKKLNFIWGQWVVVGNHENEWG